MTYLGVQEHSGSYLMKEILKQLIAVRPLSESDTHEVFEALLGKSEISDAQIGAYLFATGQRLPSANELVGGAKSLRAYMCPVELEEHVRPVIDTCGTGGSGLDTFNTSTASAFVVAASGVTVAKHGNRAATSRCGSADVLKALGVNLDLSPEKLSQCAKETGFCFIFAPMHHPATKRVQGIRKELGFRTIFNFLGPLANPARAEYQVLGVSDRRMVQPVAEALQRLGVERALVVNGNDGLDEITLTSSSQIAEVRNGSVQVSEISPEEFGMERVTIEEIRGDEPEAAAAALRNVLSGEKSAKRDLLLLNSGAALHVAGVSASIAEGIEVAKDIIDSGKALRALERVVTFTKGA
jgi:anthranilate phosphoribosyltransferase